MLVMGLIAQGGVASARADAGALVSDDTAAKIHYEAGHKLYEAKRYKEALREFDAAYQASGRAALLYNMGRCHEQIGDEKEAIRAYEDFLAEDPHNPDRAHIERDLQALRERVWSVEQGLTPDKITVAPDPPKRAPMRRYPFIIGGIGLGLLVASIGTGVVAKQRETELLDRCPDLMCSGSDSGARYLHDTGSRLAISTDVLLGLGGATVLASVITLIVEARRAAR